MTTLEQAVMTPIVFFDLFDRPVRRHSLSQLIYGQQVTDARLDRIVEQLERKKKIVVRRGFVRLVERKGLTENAVLRDGISDELWVEATNIIQRLAVVPFVKMIAVVNSLAFHNAHSNSDIDLLIVTEPGKIAVARDHITTLLTLWGRRNTAGSKRGKVAADVFLDTEHLCVNSFRAGSRDIYIDYWAAWLAPVIDRDDTYTKYLSANRWITEVFPQFHGHTIHIVEPTQSAERRRKRWEAWYTGDVGASLREWLDQWQMDRLQRYKERVNGNGLVVVQPHVLRFHVPDRRLEYQQAFIERWRALVN